MGRLPKVIGILNVLDYDYYFRLTDMLLAGDFASTLVLFDEILSKGFNALHFISGLSSHLRDLIVCRMSSSRSLLEMAPTIAAKYDEYARKCSMDFLYKALEISTGCESSYKSSGNPRLLIEFALIKMARITGTPAEAVAPAVTAAPAAAPAAPAAKAAAAPKASPAPATPAAAPAVTPSAPSVAPEAPAAPVAAPSKPRAKAMPSLSISDMMSKADAAEPVSKPAAAEDEKPAEADVKITPQVLEEGWKKFLATVKTPNLRANLAKNTPVYSEEENTVTQFVASELQKNWIVEQRLPALQSDLRKALGNGTVRLKIEVMPQQEQGGSSQPYMPTEVAKAMMNDSEKVAEFGREFELEVS